MSGRHRKPTTSSIGVAKIVVTGAVLGGSSLGLAAQAQAATDSEWDIVASCESSGNWSINTGNGYHGGLQFAPSTWLGFGGGQFASSAHMATRDEQIAIAEKVLAGQGKGAWPTCGRGLSGPTQRDVPAETIDTVDTLDTADTVDSDVVVTPLGDPADTPTPAATLDAPLPAAPAEPQDAPPDAPTPELEIIAISETTPAPDPIVVSAGPETAADPTIVQASLSGPVPMNPADPAVPPVPPSTAVPAPADPAGDTSTVASDQLPADVPHLPSPDNPPPGTSSEPVGPSSNPNVSYLKDLWQAMKDDEIDRNDLLIALSQRSFTSPIPGEATAPAPAGDPALAADPALSADPALATDPVPTEDTVLIVDAPPAG